MADLLSYDGVMANYPVSFTSFCVWGLENSYTALKFYKGWFELRNVKSQIFILFLFAVQMLYKITTVILE